MAFQCQDISDLGKLCRLCLSQENTLIPIYFQFSGTSDVTFASKINETLGLETSAGDCLPQNICQPCCQMIDKWYTYKLACQLLDTTLRRCATKLKAKKGRKLLKVVPEGKSSEFTIFVAEQPIVEDNQKPSVRHVSQETVHSSSKDPTVGFGGLDSSALSREEMIEHLSCKFCGKFFSRYNNRIKHENQYHKVINNSDGTEVVSEEMKVSPYACSFCPRKFSRLDNLKTHKMRVHSKVRPFFCECGSGFVRKQDLVWHQNTHVKNEGKDISEVHSEGENTSGKSLECAICDATFSKTEKLNEHIEVSHIESQYECSLCQCKFLSLEELTWHQKKPVEGSTASIPLSSSTTSLSHFMCNICNQSFVNIGMTKSHLLRVHGFSKNSLCCQQTNENESASPQEEQCETYSDRDLHASGFSKSLSVMDEHSYFIPPKTGEETSEEQIYFCSQCGKDFKTLARVLAHEKLHGKEAFNCKDCGKSFSSSLRLRMHSTIHTDIKPYSCSICKFTFRLATNLTVHMKRHSSDPHYVCTTCGKEFLSVGGLKRHVLLHVGLKKYPCEECGKLFFTEPERRRHMKYHSGDKTYSCPYCDKTFYEQGHLSKHVMSHSEHFEFSCKICSLSFSSHKKKARHDNSQAHLKKLEELQSEAASNAWILNNMECEDSVGEATLYNDLEASENDHDFTCNDSPDFFDN